MAHEQSPFEGERFLMREDSRAWPSESNIDARKEVRFVSTSDFEASDRSDLGFPPPHPSRTPKLSVLPILFGAISLIIALLLPMLRMGIVDLPLHHDHLLSISFRPAAPPVGISPAIRSAIEDLISAAIRERGLPNRASLEDLILSTLRAHEVARRGLRDFALKANGGRVALQLTTPGSPAFFTNRDDDPSIAIDDDVHAGRCWEFRALPSQLGVRLPRMVHILHITVEHLPKDLAADFGQAPRNMTVWGVVDGKHNKEVFRALSEAGLVDFRNREPSIPKNFLWAPLLSFAYDINAADAIQTFPIPNPYLSSGLTFGIVVLEVHENWGSTSTCLYRMRVHGEPAQ